MKTREWPIYRGSERRAVAKNSGIEFLNGKTLVGTGSGEGIVRDLFTKFLLFLGFHPRHFFRDG
jgi:hypothetical protein